MTCVYVRVPATWSRVEPAAGLFSKTHLLFHLLFFFSARNWQPVTCVCASNSHYLNACPSHVSSCVTRENKTNTIKDICVSWGCSGNSDSHQTPRGPLTFVISETSHVHESQLFYLCFVFRYEFIGITLIHNTHLFSLQIISVHSKRLKKNDITRLL